jgi:hypothetical protein
MFYINLRHFLICFTVVSFFNLKRVMRSFELLRNKWPSFTMCFTFKILLHDMHRNYRYIVFDFHAHSLF